MKVLVIHGPSLDLLGSREPEIYGSGTLDDLNAVIESIAEELELEVEIHQTAREGGIIELLIAGVGRIDGAIVNPAAYAHTSRAIGDAIKGVDYPVIEVHLTNIHAREPWRQRSVTAPACMGVIAGLGSRSYVAALRVLADLGAGQ